MSRVRTGRASRNAGGLLFGPETCPHGRLHRAGRRPAGRVRLGTAGVPDADAYRFAEAAWYTATFYDALVLPGAVIVGLSGLLLVLELGLGFLSEPWLVGMWGLFLFEFIEGNTITRRQFRRTLRRSRAVLQTGELTTEDREDARTWLGQVTHFLDVPLFLVIVYYGAIRPDGWAHVLAAVAVGLVAAGVLTVAVPKLVRPP